MEAKGKVHISIGENLDKISVKCVIEFALPIENFRFKLGLPLKIDSIDADVDVEWDELRAIKAQHPVRPDVREINVSAANPFKKLTVGYSGRPYGWLNDISGSSGDGLQIALFQSSSWRVYETSVPVDFALVFEDTANYDVWEYYSTGIFAFKKGLYFTAVHEDFAVHCIKQSHKEYIRFCAEYFNKITAFYSALYCPIDFGKFEVLIMDINDSEGALIGESLLVIGKVPDFANAEEMRHHAMILIGHEFGHGWFGADWSSWEVWLGETGAEWSALLYLLTEGETKCFDNRIAQLQKFEEEFDTIDNSYVIKTADLSCPQFGAHTRGALLFYEVYRRYGTDAIKTILLTMGELDAPDTEMLLAKLRIKLGEEIPNLIERGLTARDYSVL